MTISKKALCAALLAATASPAGIIIPPACAQEAPVAFDLPAQEPASMLRALARQGGREILFADEEVRGKRAPAVRGSVSVEQAVRLVLGGSGLIVADRAGALVVRVRPQGTEDGTTDTPITVTGTRIRGASGPPPVIVMTRR